MENRDFWNKAKISRYTKDLNSSIELFNHKKGMPFDIPFSIIQKYNYAIFV
jgi:hypothetical protein